MSKDNVSNGFFTRLWLFITYPVRWAWHKIIGEKQQDIAEANADITPNNVDTNVQKLPEVDIDSQEHGADIQADNLDIQASMIGGNTQTDVNTQITGAKKEKIKSESPQSILSNTKENGTRVERQSLSDINTGVHTQQETNANIIKQDVKIDESPTASIDNSHNDNIVRKISRQNQQTNVGIQIKGLELDNTSVGVQKLPKTNIGNQEQSAGIQTNDPLPVVSVNTQGANEIQSERISDRTRVNTNPQEKQNISSSKTEVIMAKNETTINSENTGKVLYEFLMNYLTLYEYIQTQIGYGHIKKDNLTAKQKDEIRKELRHKFTEEQISLGKFLDEVVLHNSYLKLREKGFTYKYLNDGYSTDNIIKLLFECYKTELDEKSEKEKSEISKQVENVSAFIESCWKLSDAVENGNLDLVNEHISDGASPDFLMLPKMESVLILAIRKGYPEIAKLLIEKGADIHANCRVFKKCDETDKRNVRTEASGGESPLLLAIRYGYEDLARLIINGGVDLDKQSTFSKSVPHNQPRRKRVYHAYKGQETALHVAVQCGRASIVKLLIEGNADIYIEDLHGRLPLEYAINDNHDDQEMIKSLLDNINVAKYQQKIREKIVNGDQGDYKIVGLVQGFTDYYKDNQVIKNLTSSTSYDKRHENVLQKIIAGDHVVIQLLNEYAAALHQRIIQSLVHDAASNMRENIIKFFVEKYPNYCSTILHDVIKGRGGSNESDRENMVKFLLAKGVHPSATDKHGNTPLHYAAESGRIDIARSLIKNADANAVNSFNFTPLHYAAKVGNADLANLLLANGAKISIEIPDRNGKTPLHHAANEGHVNMVNILLENGADINKRTLIIERKDRIEYNDGKTPLHCAIEADRSHYIWEQDRIGVAKFLLEKGADPNIADVNRDTPLHYATKRKFAGIVKLLLEKDADPKVKNRDGKTPLYYAIKNGYEDVVKLLLENTICDLTRADQKSLLQLAIQEGRNVMVARLLIEEKVINSDILQDKNIQAALLNSTRCDLRIGVIRLIRKYDENFSREGAIEELKEAIRNGSTETVLSFFYEGSNEFLLDKERQDALKLAIEHGPVHKTKRIIDILRGYGITEYGKKTLLTKFNEKVKIGGGELREIVVGLLGRHDIDVETLGEMLDKAVEYGHEWIVSKIAKKSKELKLEKIDTIEDDTELLLEAMRKGRVGIKPDKQALYHPIKHKNPERVKLLIEKGVKPDIEAVCLAIEHGSKAEIMKLLLETIDTEIDFEDEKVVNALSNIKAKGSRTIKLVFNHGLKNNPYRDEPRLIASDKKLSDIWNKARTALTEPKVTGHVVIQK